MDHWTWTWNGWEFYIIWFIYTWKYALVQPDKPTHHFDASVKLSSTHRSDGNMFEGKTSKHDPNPSTYCANCRIKGEMTNLASPWVYSMILHLIPGVWGFNALAISSLFLWSTWHLASRKSEQYIRVQVCGLSRNEANPSANRGCVWRTISQNLNMKSVSHALKLI